MIFFMKLSMCPGIMLVRLLFYFYAHNKIYASLCIIFGNCMISVLINYFLKFFFRKKIQNHFKNDNFFQNLMKYSQKRPYKSCFLVRFLLIPSGVKEYILVFLDIPLFQFIIATWVTDIYYFLKI